LSGHNEHGALGLAEQVEGGGTDELTVEDAAAMRPDHDEIDPVFAPHGDNFLVWFARHNSLLDSAARDGRIRKMGGKADPRVLDRAARVVGRVERAGRARALPWTCDDVKH
jgi:hypothetical protein